MRACKGFTHSLIHSPPAPKCVTRTRNPTAVTQGADVTKLQCAAVTAQGYELGGDGMVVDKRGAYIFSTTKLYILHDAISTLCSITLTYTAPSWRSDTCVAEGALGGPGSCTCVAGYHGANTWNDQTKAWWDWARG